MSGDPGPLQAAREDHDAVVKLVQEAVALNASLGNPTLLPR